MNDLKSHLGKLKRPRLLVEAAKISSRTYTRRRDLRGLVAGSDDDTPMRVLMRLLNAELRLEDQRKTSDYSYSASRHVATLGAIMGEMRQLEAGLSSDFAP